MSAPAPRLADVIDRAKRARGGALIGYLPVGFPSLAESIDAAVALAENGVDIIELGPPYSDPVMDGPVIQYATTRALEGGTRLRDTFTAIREIRRRSDAAVVVMSYFNPVVQYGIDRFADELVKAGASGMITPDLIPDEAAEWIAASERTGLDRVFLAAPSSSDARMRRIAASSRGFVYAVSTMGTTGARHELDAAARDVVERVKAAGAQHACVGIGISTPEQVREVHGYADGAIVGSAIVAALRDGGVPAVAELARRLAGRDDAKPGAFSAREASSGPGAPSGVDARAGEIEPPANERGRA